MLSKALCVLLLIAATLAQDFADKEEYSSETALGQSNQDWRAVDSFPPPVDSSGWIPQSAEFDQQMPKRRRIRKRKRRPPVPDDDEEVPRRRRPQHVEESWEEMADEMSQRPHSGRRRPNPVYEEPKLEKIRDPFTALIEAEEKQKKTIEEQPTPDLKTLLKQTGGSLSLSEVLQQKNLSLTELLMGNRQAISALTERTETTTQTAEDVKPATDFPNDETTKYKRIPPSVVLRKEIDRNFERSEESTEGLTSEEVLEAQRKRLLLLHGHQDSKLFAGVTKFDVVTEESTEKRIFVPSNSKYYTSMDIRPEILLKDEFTFEMTTTSTATTTKEPSTSLRPKPSGHLPLTSARLSKLVTKSPEISQTPPLQPVPISINEVFGFGVDKKSTTESDGPFKMTIDLDEVSTKKPHLLKIPTPVPEKLKHITAKEEIMEILEDPVANDRLAKILQIRNMTLDELVEQRERGSSQLHLADIFHNKTREPEPKEEPFIGQISPDYFNNFPSFSRQQKSRPVVKKDKPLFHKEVVTVSPQDLYTITSFPTFKIEMNKNLKETPQPFLPLWKQLYPGLFTNNYESNHQENEIVATTPSTTTPGIIYEDLQRLEEVENRLAEVTNDRLNVETYSDDDDEEFINLPSGVKSAILASFAIVGLSLFVFLTILVIFKWSQKQKRRLNYSGSFSGSKIKSPILEPEQKCSFRTFMTETLGRKKNNYYRTHLQSMSDNAVWDDKKSYIM